MTFPLKKSIYIFAFVIIAILGTLLILGIRQNQLHKKHAQIIAQSEQLLFHFATVREHIIESLIAGKPEQLLPIATEVESLNAKISKIVQNADIPDEYKLTFINEVDLPGIVLLLRQFGSGQADEAKLRQLNRETRVLGERLMLFDRVLVNYAKRRVIAFQSVVIGAMGIVIFIIVNILILGHRSVATPLIELVRQVQEVTQGSRRDIALKMKNISGEVSNLAQAFHTLLLTRLRNIEEVARHNRILYSVHRAGVAISRASSKEDLFKEVSRALLFNEDYCMIWIGEPDEEGQDLMPIMTDSVATLSERRGEACVALLLSEAKERGEKIDPAVRALRDKKPVVARDILADVPKGHLKDTPFAEGQASCVALPLIWENTIYGVLNIYSGVEDCFNEEEMKLLQKMASDVAFALYFLDVKSELQIERSMVETLVKAANAMTFTLNPAGEIRSFSVSAEKGCGYEQREVLGKKWYDILVPLEAQKSMREKFHSFMSGPDTELSEDIPMVGKNQQPKMLQCMFLKSNAPTGEILFVGEEINGQRGEDKSFAVVQTSKLTSLGELTIDMAHEVNDLSNGIINYAQILADEAKDEKWQDNKVTLLDKIIKEGERIAGIAKKLVSYGCSDNHAAEPVKVSEVIAESLALVKQQFRNDGIQVRMDLKDDPQIMPVNVQHLQHVFLNILSNARYALNERYANKDPNKLLEIKAETIQIDGKPWIRICWTDHGVGIDPNNLKKVFDPAFTTKPTGVGTGLGLSISRTLLAEYDGRLNIESVLNDHTTVHVDLHLSP